MVLVGVQGWTVQRLHRWGPCWIGKHGTLWRPYDWFGWDIWWGWCVPPCKCEVLWQNYHADFHCFWWHLCLAGSATRKSANTWRHICSASWLHWSSFVVQIYTMQIHVADVKFVLLHVLNGQVLRWAAWDSRTLWIRNCETESSCPRMRVLYLCLLINFAIILYLFARNS